MSDFVSALFLCMILRITKNVPEKKKAGKDMEYLPVPGEHSPEAIVGVDAEGKISFWSNGAERLFGYKVGEILGNPTEILAPKELVKEQKRVFERIRKEGSIDGYETTGLAKDGTKFLAKISGSVVEDGKGDFTGLVAVIRDITERRRLEDDLKEAEIRAKASEAITEGIDEAILLLSKDLKIKWANEKIYELSGMDKDEVIGNYCYVVTHHSEEPCKPPYNTCPVMEVLKAGKPISEIHVHFDKRGNRFYAEVTAYPVKNENGEITDLVHITRDVTEKRKAMKEILEGKLLLEDIFRAVTDVILYVDDKMKVLGCNDAVERVFGYKKDEVIGMDSKKLYPSAEERKKYFGEEVAELEKIGYVEVEQVMKRKNGEIFPALQSVQLRRDLKGDPAGFVLLIKDITKMKGMEEKTKRRSEEILRLQELSATFLRELNLKELYPSIAKIAAELVNAEILAIPMINEDGKTFTYVECHGKHADMLRGKTMPLDKGGLCGWVVGHKKPLLVKNLSGDERVPKDLATRLDVDTAILAPLISRGRIIGGLLAYKKGGDSPFDEDDLNLLTIFANQAAVAIDKAGLFGEVERKVEERTKELKKSEEKYRSLIETMNDGIAVIDENRKLTFCNKRFAELVEYDIDELEGIDVISLFNRENQKKLKDELARRARGESSTYEIEFTTKTGKQVPTQLSATPLLDEKGNHIGSFAVITDIAERKKAEEEIRRLKEFNEDIINGITDSISVVDPRNYKVVSANKAYLKSLNLKEEDVIGKTCYEVTHHRKTPCEPPKDTCPLKETLETGKFAKAEHIHYDKDGNELYVEVSSSPIRDEKGEIQLIIHVARDVTERKKLEREMLLLQKVNNMLNIGAPQKEILDEISNGLVEVFNYNLSAIHLLSGDKSFLTCESYSASSKLVKKVEKMTGQRALGYRIPLFKGSVFSKIISDRKPIITSDIVGLLKDHTDKKSLRAIAGAVARISGLKYGIGVPLVAGEKLVGLIGVGSRHKLTERDVGKLENFAQQVGMAVEKARVDQKLKEYSIELEREVEERTKELKQFSDKTHNYLREKVNRILTLMGTRPLHEGELDDASLMDLDPLGIVTNSLEQVFENLRRKTDELERSKEELKKYSEELEQKVEDRTRQLKEYSLRLEESNRLKELWTDIMRHDLLNPVGIIKNFTDLLILDETDEEKMEMINRIRANVFRLIDMVENSSKLAKLDSVEELKFEKMDLGKIMQTSIQNLQPKFEERGIKIEYNAKDKYEARVNERIEDVFSNLLSNAIKYSPEKGRVVVDILDEGGEWHVMFKDNGKGVPDEYKKSIFGRFRRAEKGGVEGTGLGLAIVKRIVDLHKGRVWVEDNPEGGSIFYVSVPKFINQ